MTLRIGQFVTTCHVPRRYRKEADVVDRLAHQRLAADLNAHLGPSLSRQPAIVRIRYLPVRVIIPGPELNEDSLSKAWTQAFSKALFTALAYPTGMGPVEVFRADSVAAFVAGAIRDLLQGTARGKWQYAEFEQIFRSGNSQAAFALLCRWPRLTVSILIELAQSNTLDALLAHFDDLALEQIFTVLAQAQDAEPPSLSIADVLTVARLTLAQLPEKFYSLRGRRFALKLFVQTRRNGEPAGSPRSLFHSLLALTTLLEEGVFFSVDANNEAVLKRLPASVTSLLHRIWYEMQVNTKAPQLVRLNDLLHELRSNLNVAEPSVTTQEAQWISSDWCGLFFLPGTLEGLGWVAGWRRLGLVGRGGSFLLAGLAMAVTQGFDPTPRPLDPAVALFAGYWDEPDLSQLRRAFEEQSRATRVEVLRTAFPGAENDDSAESWTSVFERLKEHLLHTFASRIRGFRQATTANIVRMFIQQPGRIRVAPDRVVVQIEPSPFHIALHIAGMDSPVAPSWLGGRRLEVEIEGL